MEGHQRQSASFGTVSGGFVEALLTGNRKMSLEDLKPQLMSLPPDAVRSPSLPMATALQEAHDLYELCRRDTVNTALVAVGQGPSFVLDLAQRIDAAREAQSIWVSARDRSKSAELVALESRAAELRSTLVAAGRWNLRNQREPQATLSAIRAGEGVDDLVQDLFDLATLCEKHTDAFTSDRSFDVTARVAEARTVAQQLSESVSAERLDPEPAGVRDVRDRAFTHMDDLVSEIRTAARYAFRQEPELAKRFTSRYRRRARRSSKSDEPPTEVVEEELVGDPVAAE
jgi:hypothetical protein